MVVVSSAQYNDPPTLIRRLRSVLSPEWVIHDRVAGWFLSALQYRSGTVPTRMVYAASGWLPDRDAFLIPGLPGAIIPDGWDLDVVYEPAGADRSGLTIVATPRVVAEGASIDDTLRILQASAPAHILVPLLSQYTAAPLVSLGYKDAAWLHLFGPTQVFKTTLAEALLSMYGYTPNRRARGVVSFAADTDGTIRRWLHLYRDMPCIIDDFKTGSRADVQIVNLIQGYGDNRGRGRLTREGSYRSADDPRGLAISTGEDVWESQRSAIARTMLVDMEPGDVTRDGIQAIQDIASSGALAALGVAWIRWLTKRGKVVLTAYLIDEVRKNTEKVSQFAGVDAVRITHQTTSMFTVSRLFGEFVRETAGAAAASEYRRWASEGWMQIFRGAKEQARESLTMSPLSQMIDMMRDAVDGGRAYFRYRGPSGPSLGNPGTRCIGYVTEDAIYFRKSMTYYWFLEECAHARRDAGFSWNQVMREVRDKYASESTPMRTPDGELVRLVSIPRYLIGALDDAVATTESV